MGKRIAFCADGTWDSADKHTNVYKLYKALLTSADQIPLYDDGVGADGNPVVKIAGGAFGTGLWQKIKDGYSKISHVYEAGDQVFLFGFSRGAYTARSLAGMIAASGLPTKNFSDDMVNTAFDAYRDKVNRQEKLKSLANCNMDSNPGITMVGVWDTVGSLGIPSAVGAVDPVAYGFLDTSLNPKIKHGYHALAIDERRAQFPPTLWSGQPQPGQTLEQVWFTGAHSDVGGGEPDDLPGTTALSDITLGWMMSKANALGLQFDPAVLKNYTMPLDPGYSLDKFHESWKVFCGFPIRRHIDQNACIANSVAIRCQDDVAWRPQNLTFSNGLLASTYQIVSVVGAPVAAGVQAQAGGAGQG
ncbi:MAG: DUF2235 domain-containing protein [Acidobacteriaceae bacterium]|nr:DUF2235 domain-containing protein [Acidobacteriaceae bacterium]